MRDKFENLKICLQDSHSNPSGMSRVVGDGHPLEEGGKGLGLDGIAEFCSDGL